MFQKSVLPTVVLLVVCCVGQSWSSNSHPSQCEEGYFRCPGSLRHHPTCIPDSWVCDEDADCPGREDEQGCQARSVICEEGEFLCSTERECVPDSWVCDGDGDCDDESDENPQMCAARGTSAQVEENNDDDNDDGDDDQSSHDSRRSLWSFRHMPRSRRHNRH